MLPTPTTAAVAPPTVGQKKEVDCVRVDVLARVQPPPLNRCNDKRWGISRCADPDVTMVCLQVVDAARGRDTRRQAGEVVLVHLDRFFAPRLPAGLEGADQFFLLRVHANDRTSLRQEYSLLLGDVLKLRVALGGVGS